MKQRTERGRMSGRALVVEKQVAAGRPNPAADDFNDLRTTATTKRRPKVCEGESAELGPMAEEVVVNAGQSDGGWVGGEFGAELLDGDVEIEQEAALVVVADHALDPEE